VVSIFAGASVSSLLMNAPTSPSPPETAPVLTRRATRSGIPPLRQYLAESWRFRAFAVHWSRADVKARNFDTLFGRVWNVLNPLLFGVIYFVFVGIIAGGGLDQLDRFGFIVGNLYVWLFFNATVTNGVGSIQSGAGGVLAQSAIPRVVLPAASAISASSLFVRSLIAYVPIHFITGRGVHLELLWLPLAFVATAIFGLGIALLLAVANVYLRDVSRLLPHLLRLWLYLSPVIWQFTRLGAQGSDLVERLGRANPMYHAMVVWTVGFGGDLPGSEESIAASMLMFSVWAVGALVAGFLLFTSREDEFAIRN
jgi:ABC-type polysaccharide/polyol phosphate export permease